VTKQIAKIVGINIVAGEAWVGVVECPDVMLLKDPLTRLARAKHLPSADALHDFANRFREQLRRIQPVAVGVANTRRYSGWPYAEAFNRVTLEAAIMLATSAEEVPFVSVKQEAVFKAIEIPYENFPKRAAEQLGIDPPTNWNNRALAFGAALTLAKERC